MNRIVIIVQGGTVQAIHADEDVLIHIVDHDTEGIPADEIAAHVMNVFDYPRSPDSLGIAKSVLKEELSKIKNSRT